MGSSKEASERASSQTAPIHVRLTPEQRRRLKHVIADTGESYAQFLMAAVERHEAASIGSTSPLHAGAR